MSIFEKSAICSFVWAHILTGTQEKKFEDMFLVKIANKGTSLKIPFWHFQDFVEMNKVPHECKRG